MCHCPHVFGYHISAPLDERITACRQRQVDGAVPFDLLGIKVGGRGAVGRRRADGSSRGVAAGGDVAVGGFRADGSSGGVSIEKL